MKKSTLTSFKQSSGNLFRKPSMKKGVAWVANSSEFEADEASRTLFQACKRGDVKKVLRSIKKKPHAVNASNIAFQNSPLHLSASHAHLEVLHILIENNANVETKNYQKRTPLMMSCQAGSFECVKLLVEHGASVSATDAVASQSPLHYTCAGTGNGGERVKIVKYLLEKGADCAVRDVEMWTPLHFSAQRGFNRICKLLMEAGAMVDARTTDGMTPAEVGSNSGGLTMELLELMTREEDVANSISYVDMTERGIKVIPPFIERFKNLRRLDIGKNEIESLPSFLLEMEHLIAVQLRGNPLNTIPSVFHHENWEKIKKYLETLTDRKAAWKERKLLFVGQEGVGKTTLLKCFTKKKGYKGVDTKKNLSTDGIDIIEGISFQGDPSVAFNAWDLGGQEIYYPSHQFFLTSNSIYILVFNLADPKLDRIDYWLQVLRALGKKKSSSTVTFLVGTHMDHPICTEAYLSSLRGEISKLFPTVRFPGLQSPVRMLSCKSGLGIREFTEALVDTVKKQSFAPILAEPWIQLHEYLKTAVTQDFIEWPEYQRWAETCNVDPSQLCLVTEFLSDIGSLIHFNDPRGNLKNLVILRPQWLGDVMASLITTRHNFAKDGILPISHIAHIFSRFPKKLHAGLIVLLENFSILNLLKRKVDKEECYLVPSLLPETIPATELAKDWPSTVPEHIIEYGRVREFSFLPLGLFSRIMVAVLHIEDVTPLLFWRNGLLIEYHQQIGLITYKPDVFTLRFQVRAPLGFRSSRNNVLLLREIVEIVETIIGCYYPRLKRSIHRFVTCTHCTASKDVLVACDPFLFTESNVIEAIQSGQGALYCQHIQSASRCVSVLAVAPDLAFNDLPSISSEHLTITKQLGEGGFGIVYKGEWKGQVVAVKELTRGGDACIDQEQSIESFQEFQRECWIMSTMLHPNITQLYGVSVHPKLRMIMQFCPGGDLFDFLHPKDSKGKRTNITVEEVGWKLRYKIALDIAKGMRYLQFITPPVIHRDLRSLNVFLIDPTLGSPLRAQVADFGLSRRVSPKIKGMLGTWQWLAPEVIDSASDQYDQRADIYSFGIVLWEIATASYPFDEFYMDPRFSRKIPNRNDYSNVDNYDINVIAIKRAIIEHHIRPSIPAHVPAVVQQLISDCWHVDPEHRPSFLSIVDTLAVLAEEVVPPVDREVSDFLEINVCHSISRKNTIFRPASVSPHASTYFMKKQFSLLEPEQDLCIIMAGCYFSQNDSIWLGYGSGVICVFTPTGELLCSLKAHSDRLTSIIVVGQFIWSAAEDGVINVWNPFAYTVENFWRASQQKDDVVSGLQYITMNGNISSHHISKKKQKKNEKLEGEGKCGTVWSWLPISRSIRIWDADSFHIRYTLVVGNENDFISCLAYCNGMVWVGTRSGKVFLYRVESLELIGCFNLSMAVQCLVSEGKRVWCASGNSVQVWEWDNEVLQLRTESSVHQSVIRSMSLMPRSNQIWTGGFDGHLIVWEISLMKPLQELTGPHHNTLIRDVLETETGLFWSIGRNASVACWEKKKRK